MRSHGFARAVPVLFVLLTMPALARAQSDAAIERRIHRMWDQLDRERARPARLAQTRVDRAELAMNRAELAMERADRQRDARERAAFNRQAQRLDQQERARERQLERQEATRLRREDAAFRRALRIRDRP